MGYSVFSFALCRCEVGVVEGLLSIVILQFD